MGSQISTKSSISSTENQEIDQYIHYIAENKKKRLPEHTLSSSHKETNCMSCTLCSDIFSKKIDWRKNLVKECNTLKDKFYWAFYFPDLLKKNLDLNRDQVYILEVSWAVYLSEDFPIKMMNNKKSQKPTSSMSELMPINEHSFESKNFSFKLENDDFINMSQKTEKKLEKSQNVNIFQITDNISCIEHNSTILKIDEKALSLNLSTQHDLYEFSCPSKFIKYEENTLILEQSKHKQLIHNEDFSEALENYKRVTKIIDNHMKDPKHPLQILKSEYLHYFIQKYETLTQMEFRTSTSKTLINYYEFMLNDIRQFIRVFKDSLKHFYNLEQIGEKFKCQEMNFFNNDNLINFILSIIFTDEIYFTILEIQRKIDRFNEIIFKRNLKTIKDFAPEKFSVPEKFCLNEKTINFKNTKIKRNSKKINGSHACSPIIQFLDDVSEKEKKTFKPYNNTIEILKNINYLKSPAHKMKLLIKASETVTDEIEEFYEKYEIGEKIILTPEEFLSIFIYVVSKIKINSLISQCNFMEKFMTQSNLTDKNGYYFYMFKAAVEYVLNTNDVD